MVPGSYSPCLSQRKPLSVGRAHVSRQSRCTSLTRTILPPRNTGDTQVKVRSCEQFPSLRHGALSSRRLRCLRRPSRCPFPERWTSRCSVRRQAASMPYRDVRSCEHYKSAVPVRVARDAPFPGPALSCQVLHGRDCCVPALLLRCRQPRVRKDLPGNDVANCPTALTGKCSQLRTTVDTVPWPGSLSHEIVHSLTAVHLVLLEWQFSSCRHAMLAAAVQFSRIRSCKQC